MSRIRSILNSDRLSLMPNAWDGLSALLAQEAGFPAVFAAGSVMSASMGFPDLELYSKGDVLSRIRDINLATDLVIMADMDAAWGTVPQTIRAVREFELAGADAGFIEDQVSPKRCPLLGGPPPLLDLDEAVAKIRAAVGSRDEMLIVARTDAGGDEMIRRAEAYAEAGADVIFPASVNKADGPDVWAKLIARLDIPVIGHQTPGHWMSELSQPELLELGIRVVMVPLHGMFSAIKSIRACYARLSAGEIAAEVSRDLMTFAEFSELLGYPQLSSAERAYRNLGDTSR